MKSGFIVTPLLILNLQELQQPRKRALFIHHTEHGLIPSTVEDEERCNDGERIRLIFLYSGRQKARDRVPKRDTRTCNNP